ncbi:mechanosensitive ion channel family protein [Croceicoccus marinus]|jgi:small-conductance mechanosensitive channel|uniref:Mechanosensitive ion channel n=1 Tax=Croceicoccus marinus TaxID=450378 RepID=A0A7G6VX57_9SPHN|nr:mechanosensitive ion channel domain-containing protein [Croceicoccus marinus]QNE06322.1 mechanosensitive ion channel [Croceicoccus marinus]
MTTGWSAILASALGGGGDGATADLAAAIEGSDPAEAPPAESPPTDTPLPPADPPDAEGPIEGAEQIKEALQEHSMTLGGVIDKLDSWGVTIGDTRFSVWTAILVVMVLVGIFVIGRLGVRLAHKTLGRFGNLSATQHLLADKLLTLLVWAVVIMVGIDILGIDLTALAVFSGAFGLAIGFGLQKTFGNLIAGIILLMDRSIKPGDVIAVSDTAGNETFGQIRRIGIRAVSIVTRDEKEYLIPNENLMINQVENWSYSSRDVRMQVNVGVSYNCDIKLAEKLMLEAAASCARVLKSPAPTCWLSEYGDSSVNFVIHCWIRDPENGLGNIRSEVLKKLWDLFQESEIEIPFPQRDINLRRNDQFDQLVAAIGQRLDKSVDSTG